MGGISHLVWAFKANWNDGNGWNVKLYSVANDNPWNDGYQVVSKLSSFKDPFYWVFVFFCQPPSILPTSTSGSDKVIYFLVSITFISQAS